MKTTLHPKELEYIKNTYFASLDFLNFINENDIKLTPIVEQLADAIREGIIPCLHIILNSPSDENIK